MQNGRSLAPAYRFVKTPVAERWLCVAGTGVSLCGVQMSAAAAAQIPSPPHNDFCSRTYNSTNQPDCHPALHSRPTQLRSLLCDRLLNMRLHYQQMLAVKKEKAMQEYHARRTTMSKEVCLHSQS